MDKPYRHNIEWKNLEENTTNILYDCICIKIKKQN
jgi:hypothetical protein